MKEKILIKLVSLVKLLECTIQKKRMVVITRSERWQKSVESLVYFEEIDDLEYLQKVIDETIVKLEKHKV